MPNVEHNSKKKKSFYLPGEIVRGRYKILGLLGSGTSGTVYKAKDIQAGTTVALKLINASVRSENAAAQRLHHEIRIAYNIKSDYVINLYSCFTDEHHIGLVLEYVNGTSLYSLQQAGNVFSIQEITNIGRQISCGLQAIHEAGIIHRDIKLENIILDENGLAKIADFGVSILESTGVQEICIESPEDLLAFEATQKRATEVGKVVGTIHYLSPEYLKTQICDARADIYALGIVLYELVTGSFPYEYRSKKQLVKKKVQQDPLPPKVKRTDCPKWLNNLIVKAMKRDPEIRYQTAKELYDEFAVALHAQPLDTVALETRRSTAIIHSPSILISNSSKHHLFWKSLAIGGCIALMYMIFTRPSFFEMLYYQLLY